MDGYNELLEATIDHLQALKRSGRKFVTVSPESLATLSSTPRPKPVAPVASPAPSPRTFARPTPAAPVPAREVAPIALAPNQTKPAAMQELRERALICQKCPALASSRKNVVFGVGNIDAQL